MTLAKVLGLVGIVCVFGGASEAWASPAVEGIHLGRLAVSAGVDGQKQALDAALVRFDTAVKQTATSSATAADFSEAEAASEQVAKVLAQGKSLAESDEGYRRYAGDAGAQFAIAKSHLRKNVRAFELRAATSRVSESEAAVQAAQEKAAADAATEADLQSVQAAVKALEAALSEGSDLEAKDPGYAKQANAARAHAKAALSAAEARAVQLAVAAHGAKVEAAQADAEGQISGLGPDSKAAAYAGAEAAVKRLGEVVDGGADLATKDRAYAAKLAAAKKGQPDLLARIKQSRLEAAEAAVKASLTSLDGTPGAAEFDASLSLITRLDTLVGEDGEFTKTHSGHRKFVAEVGQRAAAYRKTVDGRRTAQQVQGHKAKLDEAVAAVNAAIEGLQGEPATAAFAAADDTLKKLESVLTEAEEIAKKDRGYAGQVATVRRQMTGYRATAVRRRIEVLGAGVDAQFAALPPDATLEDLAPLEPVLGAVEAAATEAAPLAKSDRALASALSAAQANVKRRRAELEDKKVQAEVRPHQAKLEAATQALQGAVEALQGEPKAADFEAADKARADVEALLSSGGPLANKSRAYAGVLSGVQRGLPKQAATIAALRAQREIAGHRAKAEGAKLKADESIAALEGQSKHELYVAAEEAVAAMKKVAEEGAELGAQDRAHGAYLAGLIAAYPDMRATIRERRIETAENQLKEKIVALEGAAQAAAFAEAEAALKRLETVTESNRSYATGHKGYAKFVSGVDGRIKGYRSSITQKRADSTVAAHAAKVEAVMEAAQAGVQALEGEPAAVAFGAAEAAVDAAEKEIGAGEPIAKTSRTHAGLLAQSTKTLSAHRATINRRRIEVEVAAQRARIEGQAAEVQTKLEGLEEAPAPAAFTQATEAVDALHTLVEGSQPTAAKDKAFARELGQVGQQVEAHRAQIARRRVELAQAAAQAAVRGLGEGAEAEAVAEAATLVQGLQQALQEAQPHSKDRKLAGVVTASARDLKGMQSVLDAQALEAELRPHRTKLDAAEKAVEEKLQAIVEDPKPADFSAAESAVGALEAVVEEGGELGAKSKAYAQRLAALKRALPAHKARIQTRRTEVVIAAFQASVQEAEAAAQAQLEAVQAEPNAAKFKLFEEAAEAWQQTLGTGGKLADKDRGMAKFIATSNGKLSGMRAQVDKRRALQQLEAYRAQLDAAEAKVRQSLEGLDDKARHEDYQAAETNIADLMKVVDQGDELAGSDRALSARLAGLRNEKAGLRGTIRQRRIEVADRAAVAKIEALDEDPSSTAFREAEQAVKQLETVTESNASYGEQHAPFAKFVAQTNARVLSHRALIDEKQRDTAVNAHKKKVEAKAEAVQGRLQALESDPGPAGFAAAERAITELAEEVRSGEPIEATSKSYKAYLAGQRKSIAGFQQQVARQRVGLEVQGHRARVDEAAGAVESSLEALDADAPAQAAFTAAGEALDALVQVIDEGAETGAKDRAHAKHLAGLKASVGAKRKRIAQRQVKVLSERLEAGMEAVDGTPSEEDFSQAEADLTALEAAQGGASKQTKAQRAKLDRRRIEVKVAPHRAEVEAAEAKVQERLQALGEETDPAVFQAATQSVKDLESTLDGGNALALQSPAYGQFLSKKKSGLAGYTKRIDARRAEVVLAAWSATVQEAKESVEAKIEALDGDGATAGGFEVAAEAANELETLLGQSEKLAGKSKLVAKQVDLHTKSLQGYRREIARRRNLLKAEAHRAKVLAAKQVVDSALEGLDNDSKHENYQAAEEAIFALKTELDGGDEFAANDADYAKFLAGLHSLRPSMRATVRQRRVEAAQAQAQALVDGLEGDVSESDYAAAYQAVARLESVIQSNASFGKKDKGYAQFSARAMKEVPARRAAIDLKRITVVQAALDARMEALKNEPSAEAFSEAEGALAKYAETVNARASSGGGKTVKKLAAGIPALRATITMRRLEVAEEAASAQVGALSEAPEEGQFVEAERAVERYEQELVDVGRASNKGAKVDKALGAGHKRAAALRAQINRERVAALVRPHREKVEQAQAKAEEAVQALSEDADAEAFSVAEKAIADLEVEVGRGDGLRAKSQVHAKFLAATNKKASALSRSLSRRRSDRQVAAHAAELQEAQRAAEEAVSGLEGADRPDYEGADKVVEAFAEKVREGASLAKTDKGHKKTLAAARRQIPGLKASVVALRVTQAEAAMQAQLQALKEEPTPQAFGEAHDAVSALKTVLVDNKSAIKADKKLKVQAAKLSRALPGRHLQIEVARIEAAREVVTAQMKGLGDAPEAEALESAEEALDNLDKVLAAATSDKAQAKNKALKKAVGAAKKAAKKDRVKLAEAKASGVLRPHREALAQAMERARAVMAELGSSPSDEVVADADTVITALVDVVKEGMPHAKKSRAFGKSLAKARKATLGYIKTLNRARVHEKVQAHHDEVLAAQNELDERIRGLSEKAEHQDYQDAMEAASALRKLMDKGEELAQRDKKHAKFLKGVEKRRAAYPRLIRQRRVKAAVELAEAQVGALSQTPDDNDIRSAREALERAQTVLQSNAKTEDDKKFKAFAAAQRRELWKLEADVSRAVTRGAFAQLQEGASASDFEAAEQAVSLQAELVSAGARLAKKDKPLRKTVGALKKDLAANQGRIRTQRLEAALAVAQEGVDNLGEDTSSAAVYDAERAVDALDDSLKSTKKSAKGNRGLKKLRASASRKSKAFRKAIKRARTGAPAKAKAKKKSKKSKKRRRRRSS